MRFLAILIVFFLFGCASNPFRVTGGYISKEDAAVNRQRTVEQRRAIEDAELKAAQERDRKAADGQRQEDERRRQQIAKDLKRAKAIAGMVKAFKSDFVAEAVKMTDANATLDDICDATAANTEYIWTAISAESAGILLAADFEKLKRSSTNDARNMAKAAIITKRLEPKPTPEDK